MVVVWLFLAVPWVCLQFVTVVFPDHTHLRFLNKTVKCISSQYKYICVLVAVLVTMMVFASGSDILIIEARHEISNNVVCATSKASDQPAHTRSLIRVYASRLNIL